MGGHESENIETQLTDFLTAAKRKEPDVSRRWLDGDSIRVYARYKKMQLGEISDVTGFACFDTNGAFIHPRVPTLELSNIVSDPPESVELVQKFIEVVYRVAPDCGVRAVHADNLQSPSITRLLDQQGWTPVHQIDNFFNLPKENRFILLSPPGAKTVEAISGPQKHK